MTSEGEPTRVHDAVELILDHRGRTPKKLGGDFVPDGVQVISAKNVYGGRLHLGESSRFVTPAMAERWMPTKLESGDVLLTSEAPLGEVAYLDGVTDLCLGQRLFALRARSRLLNGRYLYYALRSPPVRARLAARATGTTAQGIKQSELRRIELDLPPLARQERIVEVLGALDDKIESNRRLADLHRKSAGTLYEGEFAVRSRGFAQFGRVRELLDLRYGKALTASSRVATGDVPVVGSSGVVGVHDHALVGHAGVVVGRKGHAGSVVWIDGPFWPIDTTFYVEPKPNVHPLFIFFTLRAAGLDALTSDSAVPGLNRAAALDRACLVAEPEETQRFGRSVAPLFAAAAALDREAHTLMAIRDELLPKLISGRIRVAA